MNRRIEGTGRTGRRAVAWTAVRTAVWMAVWAGAGLFVAHPLPAQESETHRIEGRRVAVYNLAGQVDVVRGSGSDVVVRLTRGGRDAARIEVAVDEIGGRRALRVLYPADRIVYPEMGRGSTTRQGVRSDGTFGGGGGERVTIRGSGDGLEAWADLRIEVPAGRSLEVFVAVGEATASGVEADLSIDTGSGGVDATDIRGRLLVDTGSGGVTVSDVEGDVTVDTGSGGVRIDRVRGERILVDTGSGRVEGSALAAATVRIDTGSGSIDVFGVDSPDVVLDTGSGSVEIEMLRDVERLDIDTGSGSVTVRVPEGLGAELEAETGSGGIDVDFPVQLNTMRRDHLRGVLGDGDGRIRIDTGSGSIRLVRR